MNNQSETNINLDARRYLMSELEKRCRTNPRYSLRAFAKALSMNPAMLSMVLSGKRRMSRKKATKLADVLGLNPTAAVDFVQSSISQPVFVKSSEKYRDLTLDQFAVISDWYHFAILSLIETNEFEPKNSWIASRLGISTMEAKAAVERLVRLGILDTKSSAWKQIGGPIMIENKISTSATRQFQSQVLKMAQFSLENDSPAIRDISSVTMAIDPKVMPRAIEEIRKFKIYLMNLLDAKESAQEVYHLAVQFYPASRRK